MESPKIRTIIIEDEAPARNLLKEYLKAHHDIELIAECSNGYEGAKTISELTPDLVLLDIQMPKITGIEMLELLDEKEMPVVIFTTAYDEYAIKAFELNACDYILKPIDSTRFDKALDKAIKLCREKHSKPQYRNIASQMAKTKKDYLERIVIKSGSDIHVVSTIDELLCLEARDDYVIIHSKNDQWLKKHTLKDFEERLNPSEFVRVHRSFIVKISEITRIEAYSKDTYIAILTNGLKISVSKSGYSKIKKVMNF